MKINVNGNEYEIKGASGKTVLEACADIGVNIPNLCYSKNLGLLSSCRACVVEIEGRWNLVPACGVNIADGMIIKTNSPRVLDARKTVLELLLSDHELDCLKCSRTSDCRLKKASEDAQCDAKRFARDKEFVTVDQKNDYIRRNPNKCIMCGRCVKVCAIHQQVDVLAVNGRGFESTVGVAWDKELGSVPCITCGQCVANCPTAALEEAQATNRHDHLQLLKEKIADDKTHVIIATAPSTRVAIGEGFGMKSGTNVQGKMVTALKKLGFDRIFDLNLAADFTIMEEGVEFISKLDNWEGEVKTLFTSCCPGWINYVTMMHPDLIPNISTTKSPQQIFGALAKTYYADKIDIEPKNIFMVMLMPCVTKSSEANRKGIDANSRIKDVDMVVTVREMIRLIKESGIDFKNLDDGKYDDPMGLSSGAGLIFGTTGGVTEAALRTVCEHIMGKKMENIEFHDLRGEKGIKVANVRDLKDKNGNNIRAAVVSGITNAERVIQDIKSGYEHYHYVEVMACPGGCVNGGAMPAHDAIIQDNFGNARNRSKTIYNMDQYNNLRRSHENPVVKQIYDEFLGKPNGKKAHELLHTTHTPRKKYN
ncbi:MAG: [FeFe] hydrogenase, group A [Firmicutes bacterium]|nr:[FeFe] hydrogenase, group A [Bacillota bacterium]